MYIMRNGPNSKIKKIISLAEKLPYFGFSDLLPIENDKAYLKTIFSRYVKRDLLLRLKKGCYVSKKYIDEIQKTDFFSSYLEFLTNILYQPSYLSLDYILHQHNLLTELPINFVSITPKKTTVFSNKFGNFFYHSIKKELFCGFKIIKESDFTILKASKAKALFDFLYLRKNLLVDKRAIKELRLNLDNFDKEDVKELEKYINLEGSKKMKKIFNLLWKK